MARIMIVEDDEIMAECIAQAIEACEVGTNAPAQNIQMGDLDVTDFDVQPRHEKISTTSIQPQHEIQHFTNAIAAMAALDEAAPDLIILDIVLDGPDGFSFLNELASYDDAARIPVLIMTSLEINRAGLEHYGVKRVLQKETMTPSQIRQTVKEILSEAEVC